MVLGSTEVRRQAVKSAVVLLSGGLDSMVCAGIARERGFSVIALTIDLRNDTSCSRSTFVLSADQR
jgi:7-cyano-7-deazaguanine synthase in queuosine biosynthesis